MYFNRILVNVFFLVPSISLILAATTSTLKPTTTGKVGSYGANYTTARTTISKNATSPKIGQTTANGTKTGGAAGSAGKVIATRFGADGTVEESCQCTLLYLCPPELVNPTSYECPDTSFVCCKIPFVSIPVPNPASYNSGYVESPLVSVPQQSSAHTSTDCTCAKKSECSDPDLIKGGDGLINPRFKCESPDVCCPNDKLIKDNGANSPRPFVQQTDTPAPECICVKNEKCLDKEYVIGGGAHIDPKFGACVEPDVCCPPDKLMIENGVQFPPPFVQSTNTPAQECICVKYEECLDKEYVTSGGGIINPKFGTCVQPNVCCPPHKVQYSKRPVTTPTIIYHPPPPVPEPTPYPPPQPVDPTKANPEYCGKRQSVEKRITAPEDWALTDFGEFPWMVLILEMQFAPDGTSTDKGLLCGGSLVSGSVVLTAAHCIHNKDKKIIKVRAGEYDTRLGAHEPKSHQDRSVDSISIHEKFHKSVLYNDIALIRVTQSFIFDSHVFPICVPLANSWYAEPHIYDPTQCVATGWGKNAFHNGHYQNTLKKVDLSIFPKDECQSELKKTKLGNQFELHSSFICAKGMVGHDTCKGDGGGPLVCALRDYPNTYVQVGIVAWGIECGNDVPAVYASLEANKEWLTTEFNSMSVFSRKG